MINNNKISFCARLVLYIHLSVFSITASAQHDTLKALFIGNSLTYFYDVPGMVKGFADSAGRPFKYESIVGSGVAVGDISLGTTAHMYNPAVYDMIRADDWDYVIVQDHQLRFGYGHGIFPDTAVSKVLAGHLKIRDSVAIHHPCAQMIWFAGWNYNTGYPGMASNGRELIDNIYENYQYLKDTAGGIISPIGIAWERATDERPEVDLWGPDGAHQSIEGAYLTAAVLFTTLCKTNTNNNTYNSSIDSGTARVYRRVAYQTVIDSISTTNLNIQTPEMLLIGSTLSAATGYTAYTWYKDGLEVSSGTSNTLSISSTGCYEVLATDDDLCGALSLEQCYDIAPLPLLANSNLKNERLIVYPNPATDRLFMTLPKGTNSSGTVTVTDIYGKILLTTIYNKNISIDVSNLTTGMYIANVKTATATYKNVFLKN